jgi:DNA polymerase I-like protein with 3'-5' exonuclease and polymerase domains
MWQLDPKYVGPYAEWDAWAPVHIWKKQMEEIKRQGLEEVPKLELAIQPILWLMRLRGIPVNVDAARKLAKQYLEKSEHTIASIVADYGTGLPKIDIWSGTSIASYCNINKVYYPRTGKGNPSFTKEFLESSSDKMLKQIRVAREYQRLSSVFIQGWIIDNQIDGYVHPQWKQLATDDGGTRTGRMAAANPNPQQVPKRSAQGKVIRGMFMHSTRKWAKLDYSQQEPRILMHFAYLMNMSGAAEARQMFLDNPDQDFYNMMMELASIERPQAKDLYLGRCYGMGIDKLADKLRCDIAKAGSILQQFDSKVPFIKELSEFTEHKAQQRGYIRTLSGRRRHFNMWEPSNYRNYKGESDLLPVESSEAALAKWPGIQIKRSDTRKALNSLIQGSAADMTKYAMVKIYEETGEYPYMQVHDELNYPCDSMEQAEVFKRMMENCVQLSIPIKADLDWGKAWN